MIPGDWDRVRELGAQHATDAALPVTDDLRELLIRVAPQVAISTADAQQALAAPTTAAALLREVAQRIRDGSRRLSRALVASAKLKDAGDFAGARKVLEEVAAVEVVPLYLEQVQAALDYVDEPEDDA
ncbi:DUSAM domain-containing protein [Corallococcus sp. EGB]|uniref:DUSAM domain-containing protein n=1 Tax=Corallococcus sp. EGB TaxID=1521117 RepID=UPI001CBEAE49|nr:DUSAM domain-containing protein [Corallococcus sp. EGB]